MARAEAKRDELRETFVCVRDARTLLERNVQRDRERWWTFAGGRANAGAGRWVGGQGSFVLRARRSLNRAGGPVGYDRLAAAVDSMREQPPTAETYPRQLDGLKFAECLPEDLGLDVLRAREADPAAVAAALAESITTVTATA